MGNDKRKGRKELIEAKKRAQLSPDKLWDRIDELLVMARNNNIPFMITELEKAKAELQIHKTNKFKVTEIATRVDQMAKQLATFNRSKSNISGNVMQKKAR